MKTKIMKEEVIDEVLEENIENEEEQEEIIEEQDYNLMKKGIQLDYIDKLSALSKKMTMEEEKDLIQKAQGGDQKALEKMVEANMDITTATAMIEYKRIQWIKIIEKNLTLEDIIQEAHIGLITAIKKFNISQDVRFHTYAMYWIKNAINHLIYENSSTLSIPMAIFQKMITTKRIIYALTMQLFREPTEAEIINYSDGYITQNDLNKILPMIKEDNQENGISIDAINFDGMDTSSADSEVTKPIADDSAIDNYLNIEKREKTTKIQEILSTLPENDRVLIECYYGFNNEEPCLSFEKTSQRMQELGFKKISKQAVQVKHARIMKKLRANMEQLKEALL